MEEVEPNEGEPTPIPLGAFAAKFMATILEQALTFIEAELNETGIGVYVGLDTDEARTNMMQQMLFTEDIDEEDS